jgi:hypothetical protein
MDRNGVEAARSANTVPGLPLGLREWIAWCTDQGFAELPADPAAISLINPRPPPPQRRGRASAGGHRRSWLRSGLPARRPRTPAHYLGFCQLSRVTPGSRVLGSPELIQIIIVLLKRPARIEVFSPVIRTQSKGAVGAAGQGCSGPSGTSVAAPRRRLLPGGIRHSLAQGLDLQRCPTQASAEGESW